jgi:hypothetical protein
MKRKLVIVVLVVSVALLATTPALAAGPRGGKGQQHKRGGNQGAQPVRQSFSLVGIMTAVDSSSITVQVYSGNRLAQPYVGQALTVQLTGSTRYRQWQPGGCIPISFDGVAVGATASIQGTVSDDIFTAQRVTVDVPCCT